MLSVNLSHCWLCLGGKHLKRFNVASTRKLRILIPSSISANHRRYLSNDKSVSDLSSLAKIDALSIERSDIVRKLCDTYMSHDLADDSLGASAKKWSSNFIRACHALESYMLLHHHKIAKNVMHKFKHIDPDRKSRFVNDTSSSSGVQSESVKDASHAFEENSFLTQFAYVLCKAGYSEVPQDIVNDLLKNRSRYGNIEIDVNQKNYAFIRFWVYGKKEKKTDYTIAELKNQLADEILHERVIVAARSKTQNNMILKGFKDIAVGHYETLLPEAKILVPQKRRWFLNTILASSFFLVFFNIVMFMITDLKFHSATLFLCFMTFVVYKTYSLYDINRKRYILQWKNLLYFKSTANNSGLVMDSMNQLHIRSVKEILIVYGVALMLTRSGKPVSEEQITNAAKEWLGSVNDIGVNDFDFYPVSSFSLLQRLGIIVQESCHSDDNGFIFNVKCPVEATQLLLSDIETVVLE